MFHPAMYIHILGYFSLNIQTKFFHLNIPILLHMKVSIFGILNMVFNSMFYNIQPLLLFKILREISSGSDEHGRISS